MIGCALFLAAIGLVRAETNSFAGQAEKIFSAARLAAQKNPTNTIALVHLARATFNWAEYARHDDQREEIALQGIAAARSVTNREPTNAAALYWLGMDLGQLARTKTLGALKLVREIEELFHRARKLDPHTDHAGPDRSLGRLYRDAPGWPTSIGSRKKAREHLEQAVELHPEFPENQLELLESFAAWGERKDFDRQFTITEKIIAEARLDFTGAQWDGHWADWNQRLAKMKLQRANSGPAPPSHRGK